MARRSPLLRLPLVLLGLLAADSRVWTVVPETLHKAVGQTASVRCDYQPQPGPYVMKAWCHQTSLNQCTRVVTTSQPRTEARKSRSTIWDDPVAGFFIVTVAELREEDSGSYWCGKFNASRNQISILRNISLVVSPALPAASTWATDGASTGTVLATSAVGTSGRPSSGSEYRNSSWSSFLAAPGFLVTVHCGLLTAKGLVLSALCMALLWQRCRGHKDTAGKALMVGPCSANPAQAPENWDSSCHVPGHVRNIYCLTSTH